MESQPSRPGFPEWLPRVLAESAVVVFSVLFALAVDGWREKRELQRQVASARVAFADEISRNRELLNAKNYLPYHTDMHGWYRQVSDAYWKKNYALADSLQSGTSLFNTGVHPPPLRDAVWRSLSQSDLIRHMKPEELFLLADVYREQGHLDRSFENMLTVWYAASPYKDVLAYKIDDINTTRMFLADVIAAEGRLLKRYDEALAALK